MRAQHIPALAILALCAVASAADKPKIRPAAVAGAFYPADPRALEKMVDDFLASASATPVAGPVVALVSPHAGYVYSGRVAAAGYSLLKGRKFERVVVISPSHVEAFGFVSIYDGDAYATPLGTVPVDKTFAAKLAASSKSLKLSGAGHTAGGGQAEHALEVQLPFLQRVLGEFKLVPIVMGAQDYGLCRTLGVSLAKLIQGQDTLIVASSDLSHFHPYGEAAALDRKTLNAITEWDYLSLSRNLESRVWEACGGGPVIAAMIAAERLGANEARLLKYANSGDVTGERDRVVGYGSAVLVKAQPRSAREKQFALNGGEKQKLLAIARMSVETAVGSRKLYEPAASAPEALARERGAFVTLKIGGRLRGCIGYTAPMKPLALTVRDVATFAALKDPRFPPVSQSELRGLEYEISVLSPLRRVLDVKQIRVGLHGLVIKRGENEGLLLPQVATEEKWDRNTFLEQACVKAGLPPCAWQDEGTDVFTFTAVVFGERTYFEFAPEEPALQRPSGRPEAPEPGSRPPSPMPF